MMLRKLDIIGFRGLIKESILLNDLTVFSGEMGMGKTSRLLAILFGLTNSTLPGLNLDDLINVESDFMWTRIEGVYNNQSFFLERRKKHSQATLTKTDLAGLPKLSGRIFIEGREISKLFVGAPTEKIFKIDSLLGLSVYDQVISEITTSFIDRRIDTFMTLKSDTQQYQIILQKMKQVEEEIDRVDERLLQICQKLASDSSLYNWAEEVWKGLEEYKKKLNEIQNKKSMIERCKAQLASIPAPGKELEDEVKELEARYTAMQKRVAFLEAAMQTLDIQGKKIDEITLCPLCGALISPNALEKFEHYGKEYKEYIRWVTDLESLLEEKRKLFEEMRRGSQRREVFQHQINLLENEISSIQLNTSSTDQWEESNRIIKTRNDLTQERKELEVRKRSLEEQKEAYKSTYNQVQKASISEIEYKIETLKTLGEKLKRIKNALLEAVNETRNERLNSLRASFKETYKKIYPYHRFTDVEFEMISSRGREILQAKAKTSGGWIYSHQMSTGENVAVSFALLYSINHFEKSPILLLDEPEEGLDENGIKGLAEVLRNLKATTQIVVATRSPLLAQILQAA
jgi:DNA repair exonuclease SbcCD ATPase subunit